MLSGGEEVLVELTGSPESIIYQKEGVFYAVNIGGPTYQAHNDIVYTSEFSQYVNYDPNVLRGEFISHKKKLQPSPKPCMCPSIWLCLIAYIWTHLNHLFLL